MQPTQLAQAGQSHRIERVHLMLSLSPYEATLGQERGRENLHKQQTSHGLKIMTSLSSETTARKVLRRLKL